MVKRSSPLLSFLLLGAVLSGNLASGSVISASKASLTNFELQTNLVTCGSSEGSTSTPATNPNPPADSNAHIASVKVAGVASTMGVAVCSPPESKLFGNVKIVNGTPHPGPTGVRGRLYDVGTLCDAKVANKIDRAWIAFLDCAGGCSLATKLANLESSNPQAILIYNETSCIFPTPQAPAPLPAAPLPSSTAVAAPVATAPAEPAAPAETKPDLKTPPPPPKDSDDSGDNGGEKSGGSGGGDDNGGGGGGGDDDDSESANKPNNNNNNNSSRRRRSLGESEGQEDSGYVHSPRPRPPSHPVIEPRDLESGNMEGFGRSPRPWPHPIVESRDTKDKDLQDTDSYTHSPRPRPPSHPIIEPRDLENGDMEGFGRSPRPWPHPIIESRDTKDKDLQDTDGYTHSPRPRPRPHPIIGRRDLGTNNDATIETTPATSTTSGAGTNSNVAAVDFSQATVQFGTTVAIVESSTVDYLFKTLLGPALNAPLPTALRSLRTTTHPSQTPELGTNASGNSNSVTDLMVSISPSNNGDAGSGDHKFLSMSKPIFATVIGVLSVVVCAVVLAYVVRPLYLRHRQKNEDRIEEGLDGSNHTAGDDGDFNNYHHDQNGGGLGTEAKLDPEQFYEHYQLEQQRQQSYGGSRRQGDGHEQEQAMPALMSTTPAMAEKQIPVQTHYDDNDVNTVPAANDVPLPQLQQQTRSNVGTNYLPSSYETTNTNEDDALFAQQQLPRLREQHQQQETTPVSDNVTPMTETNLHRASLSFDGELASGLPACRQQMEGQHTSTTSTASATSTHSSTQEREPVHAQVHQEDDQDTFAAQEWEEDPVPESRRSSGSRHGSELFHIPNFKKAAAPPNINTSRDGTNSVGDFASVLYRQRQSMENSSTSTSTPVALSAHTAPLERPSSAITGAKSATPRASFSDDFPRRFSSESKRQ